jgi:hypothetical protein
LILGGGEGWVQAPDPCSAGDPGRPNGRLPGFAGVFTDAWQDRDFRETKATFMDGIISKKSVVPFEQN